MRIRAKQRIHLFPLCFRMSSAPGLFPVSEARAAHIRNLRFWTKTPQFQPGNVVLITGGGSGIGRQVCHTA